MSGKIDLIKTFTQAAQIPSPSGEESEMATWVENKMEDAGWEVWIDKTGRKNDSNSGNVYAYLEANRNFRTLVFAAHLDTIQGKGEKVKVIFDGKKFASDGTTILGADNKAGIATLVTAANRVDKSRLKHNILFFFPTREEAGVMGSTFFKFKKASIKYVFNVDSSAKPGVFVYKSLGYINFSAIVKGKSSHAAKEYDRGRNAILAAADLLTTLPIGKHKKKGFSLNIGTIKGGEKTNAVCDLVEMKGELRGFSSQTMDRISKDLIRISKLVESKHRVSIDISFDRDGYIAPFLGKASGEIVGICKQVSRKVGLKASFQPAFSTSDANSFSGLGYEVISVSRGGENAHSKQESLKLSDLQKTVELILAIISVS